MSSAADDKNVERRLEQCGSYGSTSPIDDGLDPTKPATLVIPLGVEELRLDITQQRLIRIVGIGRDGNRANWVLKVTRKGGLSLN